MPGENPVPAIDFGELAHSEKFTATVLKLNKNLIETKNMLECAAMCDFEKFSVKDQVVLDLYMTYAINSLYWMYLRTNGINPTTHAIKSEINRVRECVARARKVHDRKKPTSRLDKDAAKRFITSGLWKPGDKQAVADVSQKRKVSPITETEASSSSNKSQKKGDVTNQLKSSNDRLMGKKDHLGPPFVKKGKITKFEN